MEVERGEDQEVVQGVAVGSCWPVVGAVDGFLVSCVRVEVGMKAAWGPVVLD